MLFDTHCHLNFSAFNDNYHYLIADCLSKNIGLLIIGSQIDTSRQAVVIANEYSADPVYASIGLHPIHLSQTEVEEEEIKFRSREQEFEPEKYQELINGGKSKIVAIGETGLDYWHESENIKTLKHENIKTKDGEEKWKLKQKDGFMEQLEFAAKNNLPVILHARGSKENPEDAYEDMLEILNAKGTSWHVSTKGVVHCFGADKEIAQKFLDLGFYLGFTGVITFKNKSLTAWLEVVKFAPLERILVETDAPYLAPEPHRGEQNVPQYVEFIARKIAEIKNVTYELVCQQTTENVRRLFF